MHRLLPYLQRQFLASVRMVHRSSLQRLALMWAMALALLAGHVQGFAAATVDANFVTGGVNSPMGMAVDAANNLYVASWGDNKIVKFAASGGGSWAAPAEQRWAPSPMSMRWRSIARGICTRAAAV